MDSINDVPMDIEKKTRKGRKKHTMIIGVSFLAILLLLFFTAFSGKLNLLGNVIGTSKNITSGTEIKTDLTIPEMSLDQEITRLEISSLGNPKAKLFVDDNVFEKSYKIVLENFEGDIDFDKLQIKELDGKAKKVIVNDVPFDSISGKNRDIEIEGAYDYDYLSIEDLYIKRLEYNSSGTVQIGKGNSISVNNERVEIEQFFGDLIIQNNRFKIEGILESLNVPGISVY